MEPATHDQVHAHVKDIHGQAHVGDRWANTDGHTSRMDTHIYEQMDGYTCRGQMDTHVGDR